MGAVPGTNRYGTIQFLQESVYRTQVVARIARFELLTLLRFLYSRYPLLKKAILMQIQIPIFTDPEKQLASSTILFRDNIVTQQLLISQ